MLRDAELSFPNLSGSGTTEEKLTEVQNYLFQLLEALRYTLRNLNMRDNFNQTELGKWVGETIQADTIISNTVITNEMYADYGAVADLVVDELRTDYMRARRYLEGDTSDLDYIHIHDEEISFVTAVLQTDAGSGAPLTEQLHHGTRYFWWRDAGQTEMTSLEDTGLPVTVYRYTEYNKGKISFVRQMGQTVIVLKLGAGVDAGGLLGTLRISKGTDGASITYHASGGGVASLSLGEDASGESSAILSARSVMIDSLYELPIISLPDGSRWEFGFGELNYYDYEGNLLGTIPMTPTGGEGE
ncbi:MAG: hypothetical protein IKH03_09395 [Oscillospiraceae bacterium]|nr:hypothetical protein [Oscillospiraceae bacterium]